MPRYVYRGTRTVENEKGFPKIRGPVTSEKIGEIVHNKTKQALIEHWRDEYNYLCLIVINEFFGETWDHSDKTHQARMRSLAVTALKRRHPEAYEHLKVQIRAQVHKAYNYNPRTQGSRRSEHEEFIQRLVDAKVPTKHKGVDLS